MVQFRGRDVAIVEILMPHSFACMDMASHRADPSSQCFPTSEAWVGGLLEGNVSVVGIFLAWKGHSRVHLLLQIACLVQPLSSSSFLLHPLVSLTLLEDA